MPGREGILQVDCNNDILRVYLLCESCVNKFVPVVYN